MSLCFQCFPGLFLVHPIIAYSWSSTWHGPFAWHYRTKINYSNAQGESSSFSFHLLTALLNIPILTSLTSPIHSCLFLCFPLLPSPCLSLLGKPEEVYGVCAAEEHWKSLKIPGKRPGPQLSWSRHWRWGRLCKEIAHPYKLSALISMFYFVFALSLTLSLSAFFLCFLSLCPFTTKLPCMDFVK